MSLKENYDTDNYLLFDTYNDTIEQPHPSHKNYYPAVDAVVLRDGGPVLGPHFTQEVMIYREVKELMPTGIYHGICSSRRSRRSRSKHPGRITGSINNQSSIYMESKW